MCVYVCVCVCVLGGGTKSCSVSQSQRLYRFNISAHKNEQAAWCFDGPPFIEASNWALVATKTTDTAFTVYFNEASKKACNLYPTFVHTAHFCDEVGVVSLHVA